MFWQILFICIFLTLLGIIAFIDMTTMKIPNLLIILLVITKILSAPFFSEMTLAQTAFGVLSVSFPMFIITFIIPGAFGGGDIKLMAACGAFLGWRLSIKAFILAILTAAIYCIYMLITGQMTRKSEFALGPFLCLGILTGIITEIF